MKEALAYGMQWTGLVAAAAGLVVGLAANQIRAELGLLLLGMGLFFGGRALSGRVGE